MSTNGEQPAASSSYNAESWALPVQPFPCWAYRTLYTGGLSVCSKHQQACLMLVISGEEAHCLLLDHLLISLPVVTVQR
jgi:hypothetical protein